MKNTLLLANYQLRAMRTPFLWLLALMGPLEFACMTVGFLYSRGPMFGTPHQVFPYVLPVLALSMILAGVLNFSVTVRQNGRAHSIYTMMTLPGKRSQVYWSGVISGVVSVWTVMMAQAVWFLLLYAPVGKMIDHLSRMMLNPYVKSGALVRMPEHSSFIPNGLFLSMIRSRVMRVILPMSLSGFVVILVSVVVPVACLQAIACRRGGLRVLHLVLFVCSTGCMLFMLALAYTWGGFDACARKTQLVLTAVQLCFMLMAVPSALSGLKKARNL